MSSCVESKVFLEEKFDSTWESRWVKSSWKKSDGMNGDFLWTAGRFFGDDEEEDKGIKTTPDAKFFGIAAPFSEEMVSNEGKDLVVQYSVKHEQGIDCGGGYLKLLPASSGPKSNELKDYDNETPYSIMFGPDICGGNRRVHVILEHDGANHLIGKSISPPTDQLTHLFTLILKADNTYSVLIDNVEKESGSLADDWEMLPPKKIKDPEASKPDDWVDEEMIEDADDVKPDGYDDIPEKIPDPDASKPEDWDDEDDGEWEAPLVSNPDYQGPWSPKLIKNPDYKGPWVHPEIDNPEYAPNDKLYVHPNLKYVGFELWQVKSGTIFDNILVTDDIEYARKFAEDTTLKMMKIEKEKYEAFQEAEAEKAREEREEFEKKSSEFDDIEKEDIASDDEEEEEEEEEHDGSEL